MDMEKRIMREKIEALESACSDLAKQGANKDVEIHRLKGEIDSLKAHMAMIMRDREFTVHPRIFN